MHPSRTGILAFLAFAWPISFATDARAESDDPILTPITKPLRAANQGKSAIPRVPAARVPAARVAMAEAAPKAAEKPAVAPVEEGTAAGESCGNDAPCQPYYRNRPYGCQADRIKLANRMGEPDWYRYYRCVQFGYHPTQWHPWPEGWLACRYPQPGKHPYDIERPKPDKRILDRERRLQGDRQEPELLDEPLPRRPGDEPRQLPPPQNSTPPITPGPSGVPNVPNPIVR